MFFKYSNEYFMTIEMHKSVVERIQKIKKDQNITTDAQFADTIGENRSNFSQALKGESRKIGDTLLYKIAVRFNVNINWLLKGEGSMYRNSTDMNMQKLLDSHETLVSAHIILVENSKILTETNKKLTDQNQELLSANKDLRDSNNILMKELLEIRKAENK